MNRWCQRLADLHPNGDEELAVPSPAVHNVQNVRNVQNQSSPPPFEHFEQIEHCANAATAPAPVAARSALLEDLEERAAIIEYDAGLPRTWAEGFAALAGMPMPDGFLPERWQRIVDAAGHFIDRWAVHAAEHGWSVLDVFGCHSTRPDARFDCMGLILLLDRHQVVAIDEKGADLLTATGAKQRFYRRPAPACTVALWDLVPTDAGMKSI